MARILVIDDEKPLRDMLGHMLKQDGYEVVVAKNSEEGLELVTRDPVDLVITDIFMPGEGGLEAIRKLKRDFPAIKVIAITGIDIREEIDVISIAKSYGADCGFVKPFSQDEMLQAANLLLAAE